MTQETLPAPASTLEPDLRAGPRPSQARRAAAIGQRRGGMWAWLLQRVTAGVLIFGLTSHLVATHIVAVGQLSDTDISQRLASSFFVVVDVSLLAAALFHALAGVRMVVLDYCVRTRSGQRTLTASLWAVGVLAFTYGMWALWPWIG